MSGEDTLDSASEEYLESLNEVSREARKEMMETNCDQHTEVSAPGLCPLCLLEDRDHYKNNYKRENQFHMMALRKIAALHDQIRKVIDTDEKIRMGSEHGYDEEDPQVDDFLTKWYAEIDALAALLPATDTTSDGSAGQ